MKHQKVKLVVLEAASYRERGRIHGEVLRDAIVDHHTQWANDLKKNVGQDVESYLDQFLSETDFMPAIERWTPDLLEEVRGISEGSGVDFRYILVRQLSDEEPWYRLEKKLGQSEGRGCSSIGLGATTGRPTIIGQNMDTPDWYDGYQILFHHKGPDLAAEVFNFSLAGKINLCGMNSNGLAICCNTLSELNYAKDGLPEDFVVRGFLAQKSLKDGLAFLHDIKHASGQNYTVAEPGSRAINLEASANKVMEYAIGGEASHVFHTNHVLVNDDQSIRKRQETSGYDIPGSTSTAPRFQELSERLTGHGGNLSIDDMKAAFKSHAGPVCRHPNDGSNAVTLGCLIMELTESPTLHIAPGPPCETSFSVFRFSDGE